MRWSARSFGQLGKDGESLTRGGLGGTTVGVMTSPSITLGVRGLNRVRQIAQVLTQHGFGHIVARIDLASYVPVWMMRRKTEYERAQAPLSLGQRLARVCSDLGPTFIKLSQMLTTRPDLIPADLLDGLRTLQDEVPPFDSDVARKIIAEEMGKPVEECYSQLAPAPMASGSIGQVYRAQVDDREVVVKVQRPGVVEIIRQDMRVLHWLADAMEKYIPESRVYRPAMIVEEFEQMLSRELDYINEASATERFHEAFAENPHIKVPKVEWALCSERVLTLEAISGRNVEMVLDDESAKDQLDGPKLAHALMEAYLEQIFDIGLLNTDPHPGNIFISSPTTVGLLDFGQVTPISDEVMTHLVIMVYGAVNKQVGMVVDALAALDALSLTTDRRDLQRSLRVLMDKYYGLPIKRFDVTRVLDEFSEVVRRHGVVIPREAVSLIKALGMVTSVATRLDPELDVVSLLEPRIKKVLFRRFEPRAALRSFAMTGWQVVTLLRQAPTNLRELLRRLAAGTWQLNVQHENIDRLASELDRSSNRLSIAVIIAAIIVGSSIVVTADTSLVLFDVKVQWFGIFGFLVAGILGLALSWAILRSGRLH